MSIPNSATGANPGQLSEEQIIAQLPPEMQEQYKQWKRTQAENPQTPDKDAAEKNDEREKPQDYFDDKPISFDDPNILFLQGSYKYSLGKSADRVFSKLHSQGNYFQRGGNVVSPTDKGLEPESSHSLRTTVERFFDKVISTEFDKKSDNITLKRATLTNDISQAILAVSNKAPLREINTVANCPVLVPDGKNDLVVCKRGYAKSVSGGGIYIMGGKSDVPKTVEEAVAIILEPFAQFDFVTEPDRTRAIAMAITPAMMQAGLVGGHIPIDFAEADQSQAGKGYRHDIVTAIYNESPTLVTNRRNGVGSLDESISNAILKGKPFIRLDNLRENLDSEVLESYITTPPDAFTSVRGFRRQEDVRGGQHIFQASSNGIQLTQDAANRCVIVRIRKRPDGYKFTQYKDGCILEHVKENYSKFLGAIHRIVIEWHKQGAKETECVSHDFRRWAGKLDWIMTNIFGRSDMLKGHRELQNRISDDALTTLRHIAVELESQGRLDLPLTTADLVDVLEESDVEVKGHDQTAKVKSLGVKLGKAFKMLKPDEPVLVDGYSVTRSEQRVTYHYEGLGSRPKMQKIYYFAREVSLAEEDTE